MKTFQLIVIILFAVLIACSIESREINYGQENCSHCNMTIMDEQYGAEIVTDKGKIYTYCSIECMGNEFLNEKKFDKNSVALLLCKDYEAPKQLIKVENMTFLISKEMPSPMGYNLNAFDSEEKALKYYRKNGGKIMSWQKVLEKL